MSAGYIVWVSGPCGPEIQRWADRPETSMHGTYWYEGNARVLAVVAVSAEDFAKPLDQLALKYPNEHLTHWLCCHSFFTGWNKNTMNFYHDPQRNILIYPRSELIERNIAQAKPINGAYVAIPRTLHNSQLLRHLNFPVAPVMDGYDWPAPPEIKPWESQKVASNFMVLHPRCFNLSDMGVGKTYSALWAADWLMRNNTAPFRCLIVCPLSIMQRVWSDAICKLFLGTRTFQILHGSQQQRMGALAKPADFYICNFDGVGVGSHTRKRFELDGFSAALAARDDIKLAIIDEASAYKEASTKRHRIARLVFGKKDYLWLMTGTPTPNAPTDAYGLAKLVNNAFGKSKDTFKRESMIQVKNFVWRPQKDGYDKARRLLTPSIRFDIKDVWDGPALTTQQREVPLTAEQKKHMAALKRDLQVIVKAGVPITAANEAAARQKFIQISLGAIYDARHQWHTIDASPRIEELKAVIEQAPGKILLLAPLTSVVNLLCKELGPKRDAKGKLLDAGWSREIVNGDTSAKERSRIFHDFQQEGGVRILIADPGVMAHGLDLWMAQTVIWYAPIDKTELYLQANKRAHRPGQKYPVTIVQIVSNNLEREIFRRLGTNESLQGVLLNAVRRGEL